MFFYNAFGLTLASELPLPELPAAPARPPDVTVRRAPVQPPPARPPDAPLWREFTPQYAALAMPRLGLLTAAQGREISVTPAPDAWELSLRLFILGPLMTAILHQRGRLVLHASAAAINGRALLFLGNSGMGKSSMAAALLAHGHALVTDDVAAVTVEGATAQITPSFPRLKIGAAVADALGYATAALPPLHPDIPRRRWLTADLAPAATPIQAIYVLDYAGAPAITPLREREAVLELIRHSCPTRWGVSGGGDHFRRITRLAQTMPLYRLQRPRNLAALPAIAELAARFSMNGNAAAALPVEEATLAYVEPVCRPGLHNREMIGEQDYI